MPSTPADDGTDWDAIFAELDGDDDPDPNEEVTLAEARRQLRAALEAGQRTTCLCCDRSAQYYRRKISAGSARVLILLYHENHRRPRGWVRVDEIYDQGWKGSSDYAKMRFWGLIESYDTRTADKNAAGLWRITPLGVQFVLNRIQVPKYIVVYDNELIRVLDDGEQVGIIDCLGTRFNYPELMRPALSVVPPPED